jgi:hypothetical protein
MEEEEEKEHTRDRKTPSYDENKHNKKGGGDGERRKK